MTAGKCKELIKSIYDRVLEESISEVFDGIFDSENIKDDGEYFGRVYMIAVGKLRHYKKVIVNEEIHKRKKGGIQ